MPRIYHLAPQTAEGDTVKLAVMPNGDVEKLPLKQKGPRQSTSRPRRSTGRRADSQSPMRTGRDWLRDADGTFAVQLVLMCPSRNFPTGPTLDAALLSVIASLRRSGVAAFAVLEYVPKSQVPHYHILTSEIDEAAIERARLIWLRRMDDRNGRRGVKVDATPILNAEHERHLRQRYLPKQFGKRPPQWYEAAPIARWRQTGLKKAKPIQIIEISKTEEQSWHAKAGLKPFYKRHFSSAGSLKTHLSKAYEAPTDQKVAAKDEQHLKRNDMNH